MKYRQNIFNKVSSNSDSGKASLIIRSRRVGKIALLKDIIKSKEKDVLFLNGDDTIKKYP